MDYTCSVCYGEIVYYVTAHHIIICVQTTGGTALHLAAKTGNMEIFRMLLGGGADVEVKDKVG